MDDENENLDQQQQTNPANEAAKQAASKAAKDFAKKSVKSAASNAIRSFLIPLMPWILGIAIALIVIAGIIMFFVSGVGIIFGALNEIAESFKDYCVDIWYGSHNNVKEYEIIQVADKLESMGYDLYGEGFVTGTVDSKVAKGLKTYRQSIGQDVDEGDILDNEYGVYHDNYGITNINSTIIKRYLISDNYIYTLYNKNSSFNDFFHGDNTPSDNFILPRTGLIRLISEGSGGFGTFGSVYDSLTFTSFLKGLLKFTLHAEYFYDNKIDVSINLNKKTLDVSTTNGFFLWTKTDTLSYSLDGWTGRYGMPLEFLLSMHLASEQPDLVMDMLNSFETHVNIGLHRTNAIFVPGIEISGHVVTLKDILAFGNSDNYYKKLYPSYYKKLLEEREKEKEQNPDAPADPSTPTEKTEEEKYKEELEGVLGGLTPVGTGKNGENLYEVPAGSQGANMAETIVISEDGTIYEEIVDGENVTYEATTEKYEIVHEGETEYDITNEDSVVIPYETALDVLKDAAGGSSGQYDFTTLLPYIRNVSDHWFRDAYFVIGTDSIFREGINEKVVNIIENDKDYEYTVGERWTLYETDSQGNYTLYLVNDDGSLGARYNGTQEQALEDDIRVSRKAITSLVYEKADKNSQFYDEEFAEGMGTINSSLWTAYEIVPSGVCVDWTPWDESQKKYPSGASDELKEKLRYQITVGEQIVQKRDGERSETNATIKKMLTRYKYYSYDGSVERANKIEEDRKANENYQHEDGLGNIIDGTENDPRDQNLVTKFSINADSLSAFKILENMNTLDADEIYRDFKELIVELNYFDKEELSSGDPAQFQWILPETGTIGWPVRQFSKKENVYGTLIHSKVDLKNLYKAYEYTVPSEDQGNEPSDPDEEEDVATLTDNSNITTIMGQLFLDQKESLESIQGKASNKMSDGGSGFSQGSFIETAQECWNYLWSVGGSVSYGGMGACPFAQSPSSANHKSTIDCSAWVTWVLYEWGTGEVKSHFSSQRATPALMKDNYEDLFGWTQIDLKGGQDAYPLLQPGDILVRDDGKGGKYGHTCIIKELDGGNIRGWDCGNSSHWRGQDNKEDTNISDSFVHSDKRAGKIIRVEEVYEIPAEKYEGYEGNTDVVSPITGEIVEVGKVTIQKNLETNETEEVGYIKLKVLTEEDYQAINQVFNPPKVDPENMSSLTKEAKKFAGYKYFYEDYKAAGVLGMYVYIEGIDVRIADEGPVFKDDSTIMDDGEYRSKYRKHTFNDVIGEKSRKVLENKEKLRNYAVSTFTCKVGGETKLFIKEGTVIGKTYTDGELEELSEEAKESRPVVRPCVEAGFTAEYPKITFSNGKSPNWDEIEDENKPTGNYIRVILRTAEDGQADIDVNDESAAINTEKDNIIEDVEDYIELDERIISDECPMKLQTTDIPEDEWVRLVVEYANNYPGAHNCFKDKPTMHLFYQMCVKYELNPDFLFVRAICESSLKYDGGVGNYWGWDVPNGQNYVTKIGDGMLGSLEVVCKGLLNGYITPGGSQYRMIMSRYEERKKCTDHGGIPRFGYGMPDTVPGVMSVYSSVGKDHAEIVGANRFLEADIYTEENIYSWCTAPHGTGDLPPTVWEQGSYTASQVRKMLNIAHEVWPKYYPETFENELWN